MKKYLITILTLLTTLPVFCQRGEKIKTLKIGYLTTQLNLDAKTAEKFWPIYQQYQDELSSVIKEARKNGNDARGMEILDNEQKALDIKKKYNAQFAKVLSGEQLNQLYKAEKDFRQMIINQRQQRDPAPMNRPANRPGGHGPSRMDRNDRPVEQAPPQQNMQARPAPVPRQSKPPLNNAPASEGRRR